MSKYIGIILGVAVIALGGWYVFFGVQTSDNGLLVPLTESAFIAGHWQSTQDPLYEVVLTSDGVAEDWYEGNLKDTGTWTIGSAEQTGLASDVYNPTGVFLITQFGEETFVYAVVTANDTQLTLSYLDRGNTLDFVRVSDDGESTTSVNEDVVTYANAEYGFALTHPSTWEVQEALKPHDITALHEISIHEKEYDMWRGEVTISVFVNETEQSVHEWWQSRLVASDREEEACRVENGEEAPCLFLRGMVRKDTRTTFAGRDAVYMELFQFDHTEGCTYVGGGEYIIGMCAVAGVNPNDPQADVHRTVADSIFASVVFE